MPLDPARLDLLTAREREIVACVVDGRTSADVAATLSLSRRTVENHIANVYRKLRISNRRELAQIAGSLP